MSKQIKYWLFLLSIVAVIIAVDQISKNYIMQNMQLYESIQPIPALSDYFQITYVFNTGAAFGMLSGLSEIFTILPLIIVIGLLIYYPRLQGNLWLTRFAIGMIIGGALGNLLDRLQHGHVIDFINYRIPGVISNVSNIADHTIVGGVLILIVLTWFAERETDESEISSESDTVDGVS